MTTNAANTQVSAYLSDSTREQLDRYARARGLKKGHVVEEAILHHLQALREIPSDLVIPPAVVLSPASFVKVLKRIAARGKPTKAMLTLMAGGRARKSAP